MSLKEQIESGKVFTEYGHTAQEDREYEKIIEAQRRKSKQLCFRYNQTDPMDEEGREKLVRELLGGSGENAVAGSAHPLCLRLSHDGRRPFLFEF